MGDRLSVLWSSKRASLRHLKLRSSFFSRPIPSSGRPGYQIGSKDGLRSHEIRNGHCECSDYARHGRGHSCKNRLAIAMAQRLGCTEKRGGPGDGSLTHRRFCSVHLPMYALAMASLAAGIVYSRQC